MVAIVVASERSIVLSPTLTLAVAPLGIAAVPTVVFALFFAGS